MNRWFLFLALLAAPEPLLADVDLQLLPTENPYVLVVKATGSPSEFAGVQLLLTWDAGEIVDAWPANAGDWWLTGFLPDGEGINDSLADGNAIWVGFGNPSSLPGLGTVCFIEFSDSCCVELGKRIGVARTIVSDSQAQDVTGELVGGCWE